MRIAIVRYNAGNIQSVRYALERLGVEPEVTDDAARLRSADKVLFPGVGEASTAMQYLKEAGLDTVIPDLQQPVLGICLGLQLMCVYSEENDTECLGIFPDMVRRFDPGDKVPHMGWNTLEDLQSPLFKDVPEASYVYFVHSYYAETGNDTIARTAYNNTFSAALKRDNFYAVQFHPEKSGKTGARILQNFIEQT